MLCYYSTVITPRQLYFGLILENFVVALSGPRAPVAPLLVYPRGPHTCPRRWHLWGPHGGFRPERENCCFGPPNTDATLSPSRRGRTRRRRDRAIGRCDPARGRGQCT